jgi:hypothetical protein
MSPSIFNISKITFSLTSFSNVSFEIETVRKNTPPGNIIALIGNKIDLNRAVSTNDGIQLAIKNEVPLFFELSVKTDSREELSHVYKVLAEAKLYSKKNGYNFEEISRLFCKAMWNEGETRFKDELAIRQQSQQLVDCVIVLRRNKTNSRYNHVQ